MPYPTIEEYPYLQLDIDGKSVKLNQFTSYSRKVLHGAKIDYAFSGNAIVKRTPHEPKHLWTVTALVDWATRNQFSLVTKLADTKIFAPPFNAYKLTLSDVFLSIIEPSISRPKAHPFETVGMIGDIEYFAKFLVAIDLSSIEEQPLGDWVQLSFMANELEKLTI
ncbi:hypothetical protein QT972_00160 [Microcoleus sp. herbarium7]|uniref:hypothetical protein n=1 Tax=Microcoleus sp. herbarium7 TaxID=3055435 RepID=UPI002FD2CAD9